MQGGGAHQCLLCGEEFAYAAELDAHHETEHPEPEEELTWGGCLLAIPALLIMGWRWVLGFIVVVGLILGAFGVFDKTKTADFKNCPGYGFVRELRREHRIESFDRVEPDSGFLCEYSLDSEDAFVRFKRVGKELDIEVESHAGHSEAYDETLKAAENQGFH